MQSPTHIVAACALISNASGDVLLINSPLRGWEVPGGQVEIGESLIEGVQREIFEESGIKAEIGVLAGVYSNVKPPTKVIFTFLATYQSGELTSSAESSEVRWVPPDQVLPMITHLAVYDRINDAIHFAGQIIYRVYTTDPYVMLSVHYL